MWSDTVPSPGCVPLVNSSCNTSCSNGCSISHFCPPKKGWSIPQISLLTSSDNPVISIPRKCVDLKTIFTFYPLFHVARGQVYNKICFLSLLIGPHMECHVEHVCHHANTLLQQSAEWRATYWDPLGCLFLSQESLLVFPLYLWCTALSRYFFLKHVRKILRFLVSLKNTCIRVWFAQLRFPIPKFRNFQVLVLNECVGSSGVNDSVWHHGL